MQSDALHVRQNVQIYHKIYKKNGEIKFVKVS